MKWILGRQTAIAPRVRGWLRARLPVSDRHCHGARWRLYPADNDADYEMWLHGASGEAAELDWLGRRFAGREAVFFDIGANSGTYAILVGSRLGPGSRIVAAEPNPVMSARLHTNLALNGIENVEVRELAVSDRSGQMSLGTAKSGNLGQTTLHLELATGTKGPAVDVVTLRDLARTLEGRRIDLLKIDVEGFEDRVLFPFLSGIRPDALPEVIVLDHDKKAYWRYPLIERLCALDYIVELRNARKLILSRA